jgi:hypothetical protein
VEEDDWLDVRCGRCGRLIRVTIRELAGLRTFDCPQCRGSYDHTIDAAIDEMLRALLETFDEAERSVLIRLALGFSGRQLRGMHGTSPTDLDELVARLVRRLRSLLRSGDTGDA